MYLLLKYVFIFLFQYVDIHFHYILNAVIKEQFTLHSLFLARNSRLDTGSVKILLLGLKRVFFLLQLLTKAIVF